MRRPSFAIALVLGTVACSSSNSGTGKDGQPPVLSNLAVNNQPATVPVGQTTAFTGTMQVADGDGDAQTLQVSAQAQGGGSPASTSSSLPSGASGNTSFALQWAFSATPPAPGTYVVSLTVIDSEGQTSNALSFTQVAQ